jgi:hypothetical protein
VQFEVISIDDAILKLAAGVVQTDLNSAVKRQLIQVLLGNSGYPDAMNLIAFQNKLQSYVAPSAPGVASDLNRTAQHILDSAAKP